MFIMIILLYIYVIFYTLYSFTKLINLEQDIESLYDNYSKAIENMIKEGAKRKC